MPAQLIVACVGIAAWLHALRQAALFQLLGFVEVVLRFANVVLSFEKYIDNLFARTAKSAANPLLKPFGKLNFVGDA